MNNRYAVMGHPVDHSLSPIIHHLFAEQTGRVLTYEKILIDLSCFAQQVMNFFNQGGAGLNITLPCKEHAFALADHVTPRCLKARAANTLWRDDSGLWADNTDGAGLLHDLKHYIDLHEKQILVLGAGGAARGILAPLLDAQPERLILANRTAEKAHALCKDFPLAQSCDLSEINGTFDLIINATSASLSERSLVLPAEIMKFNTLCYDLAYRLNALTPFVAWAQSMGCVAVDGLGMLVGQAAEAFAIWHGVMPEIDPVLTHLRSQVFRQP